MPWSTERADVLIAMGSQNDWETMQHAVGTLEKLVVSYDCRIISAHRTPDRITDFLNDDAPRLGTKIIIAGAGGAAHLAGMFAAYTHLPVLGVPVQSRALQGLDSLLSIVQMPAGRPVATFAIGEAGAVNAALFAASILAFASQEVDLRLREYRLSQTTAVPLRPEAFLKSQQETGEAS